MGYFLLFIFACLESVIQCAGLRYIRRLPTLARQLPAAAVSSQPVSYSTQRVVGMTEIAQSHDASERVAVITGGTSRFGASIATGLAQSGKYDKLIIIGRSKHRASEIASKLGDDVMVEFIEADLSSMDEVLTVCKNLKGIRLQCLVCAAGQTALGTRKETNDGHEYHFGLNFLSRFLMVNRLIDELSFAGTESEPARVLLIGSDRHWGAPVLGFATLGSSLPLAMGDFRDMQFSDSDRYDAWEAFGQAALCNVMFAYEIQKQLRKKGASNIAVSCVDPGPMLTKWHLYAREENREIATNFFLPRSIGSYFTRLVEDPEIAAQALITLATTPLGSLPSRIPQTNYFVREFPTPSKFPVPWNWGTSYDEESWSQLWNYAESLLGEHIAERQRSDQQASSILFRDVDDRNNIPQARLLYVWLWFWWHAPKPFAKGFAQRLIQASA